MNDKIKKATLENESLNLRLEFEDFGDSNGITVEHTKKGYYGSLAVCQMECCFTHPNDIPLTKDQLDWLDSEEVEEFCEMVGY